MIKEKDTYIFKTGEYAFEDCIVNDPQNAITAGSICEALKNCFAQNNIPAAVSEDTYSYKEGMFKRGTVPCLVVSHSSEPKKFRKIVIAVRQNNGQTLIAPSWYDRSQVDSLIEKANKLIKKRDKAENKADRNAASDDLLGSFSNMANAGIKNARINSIDKKISKLRDGEKAYHTAIHDAVAYVCGQMKG